MECQAKSIMERCGCLPYYFPEFGEVWGNVSHLGHLDWADTTCNHTQWLCLATYTGNQKKTLNTNHICPWASPHGHKWLFFRDKNIFDTHNIFHR